MNKKSLSLKVDEYTILLHRGQEETKEIGQKQMAELFDKNVRTVNEHINNILKKVS